MKNIDAEATAEARPVPGDVWQEIEKIASMNAEITDEIREKTIAIAEKIGIIAERAGIYYGAPEPDEAYNPVKGAQWWRTGQVWNGYEWRRLAVRKYNGKWSLVVEGTTANPRYWDGSNWVGHDEPFCADVIDVYPMEKVSRGTIIILMTRLPDFLRSYLEKLEERHAKYSEIKELCDKIA